MTKVVVNRCFGGFGLSRKAVEILQERLDDDTINNYSFRADEYRTNPELVRVVEELGDRANGFYAKLEVVEIPDDVTWFIDEYDGTETIREKHSWW